MIEARHIDVRAFYESIDHLLLLARLARYLTDRFILNLLWQAMHRSVEHGGVFREIKQGLPRGSPLSPLPGGCYLSELDEALAQHGVFYVRYIDDVLPMTRTRWRLRRTVKQLNHIFRARRLEQHLDKTLSVDSKKASIFWVITSVGSVCGWQRKR